MKKKKKEGKSWDRRVGSVGERALTSKDLAKVLVNFEPVWQDAKREEEYGEAKEENSDEHARGEPDLAGERRDEVVLRKAKGNNTMEGGGGT